MDKVDSTEVSHKRAILLAIPCSEESVVAGGLCCDNYSVDFSDG